MKIFHSLPRGAHRAPRVLTIGKFDGVHRGHAALLDRVRTIASMLDAQATVMTFSPHPREFFAGRQHAGVRAPQAAAPQAAAPRVANLRDTLGALMRSGVDQVIFQRFDERFASLSADAFIKDVLVADLDVRWLLVGSDFRFGAGRTGDLAMLVREGRRYGFQVETLPTVLCGDTRISSSAVRDALVCADFASARMLLGRSYAVSGRIVPARAGRAVDQAAVFEFRGLARSPVPDGIFAVRIGSGAELSVAAALHVCREAPADASYAGAMRAHLVVQEPAVWLAARKVVRVEFVAAIETREDATAAHLRSDVRPTIATSHYHSR